MKENIIQFMSARWKALLGLGFLILLPLFIDSSYHQIILNKIIIHSIVVLGLNFITGLVGQLNTGTAGMYALGAYTSALLTTRLGVSPWIGLIASVFMGILIGYLLGYPSLRVSGVYLVLTTLSFAEVVRMLLTNMIPITGGALGITSIPEFTIFGVKLGRSSVGFYFMLAAILVLFILISNRLINSKWGRAFKAVRDNPESAETAGIQISTIKIGAFTLASVFGCVAGALYGTLMGFISPVEFTSLMSVRFIMMLMVGGIGTIGGSIAGATLVTLLPELLRFMGESYWLFFSLIVLLSAIFAPNGLYSLYTFFRNQANKYISKLGGKASGSI